MIVRDAVARTNAGDTGAPVVYRCQLQTPPIDLASRNFQSNFLRQLSQQVVITGPRRLGSGVLLDFDAGGSNPPGLFAPPTTIDVTLIVPGPTAGDLAQRVAVGAFDVTAAVCAFALGRQVTGAQPAFPLDDQDDTNSALTRRTDPSILTLARNHVGLDLFGDLAARGGIEAAIRARSALLSYHAALKQEVADVATMLLVGSMEALLTPPARWDKVTKRFIVGIQDLCPDAVTEILKRPDLESSLGLRLRGGSGRRAKDLLDRIYDLRSIPTHSGLSVTSTTVLTSLAAPETLRVAILADLATEAILRYIQAPRSSIVGHPGIEAAANPTN